MDEVINLKRILSLILAQLLVISMVPLFSFSVFAAWTAPSLGLSTMINSSSNTVIATVTIGSYNELGTLDFNLVYDASKVSYTSHTAYNLLNASSAMINNVTSPGYVSAGWSTDDLTAGNSGSAATILVVTFNVVSGQSGSAEFSLTDCSYSDNNAENETSGSTVNSSVIIPEDVTDINVSIAIPVKDNTPVSSVSGMGWTGIVEWTPAIFSKFVGGTVYTADVTLTPDINYKFSSSAVKLNSDAITPTGSSSTEITFSKTFEATTDEDSLGNIPVVVNKKVLTVIGATATDRVYNETATVAITAVSVNGIINNDDVSVNIAGVTGTISSVNAGTYTSVNLSDLTLIGTKAGNYTINAVAAGVPETVVISTDDAPTIVTQELYFARTEATSGNTFDIKPLLPSDRGTTNYGVPASAGVYTRNPSVSTAGVLTFGTNTANSAVSENITVTVTMQNYKPSTVTIKVILVDQIVLTGTPAVTGTLIYGQKLSNLNITVIMKDGITTVPGTIVWDNPNFIPSVGAAVQTWTFTPSENNTYSIKKGNSPITVNKATPTITLSNKSVVYTGSFIEINTAVVLLVNNEIYNGDITYNYYNNIACTILTTTTSGALYAGSAPIKAGTYYCKASIVAIGNYNAASSNIATLIINAPAYYTVSNTAGTGGKITPKQTNVAPGGNVTITITPNDGYKIAYVKIDSVLVDTKSTYKLENISQDHTVTVTFQKTEVTDEEPFAFTDVTPDAWYYDSILFVYNKGLMKGVSSELFDPQGTMTRAMLVTVLWRMDGSPATSLGNNPFSDVTAGQCYTNAVLWAYGNDIVYGYDNDTFGPGDYINREQLMTIIYRYLNFSGSDMTATNNLKTFSDAGDISDWALDAMKFAVGEKLITGVTSTTLEPKGNATRAQVATILARFV